MSGLEIRELECFLALSEELHFGRAAERLYVSQSRISQLLRALEGRIGARLLDRTSRRVRLTPARRAPRTTAAATSRRYRWRGRRTRCRAWCGGAALVR